MHPRDTSGSEGEADRWSPLPACKVDGGSVATRKDGGRHAGPAWAASVRSRPVSEMQVLHEEVADLKDHLRHQDESIRLLVEMVGESMPIADAQDLVAHSVSMLEQRITSVVEDEVVRSAAESKAGSMLATMPQSQSHTHVDSVAEIRAKGQGEQVMNLRTKLGDMVQRVESMNTDQRETRAMMELLQSKHAAAAEIFEVRFKTMAADIERLVNGKWIPASARSPESLSLRSHTRWLSHHSQ